jgi:hypothetical protein
MTLRRWHSAPIDIASPRPSAIMLHRLATQLTLRQTAELGARVCNLARDGAGALGELAARAGRLARRLHEARAARRGHVALVRREERAKVGRAVAQAGDGGHGGEVGETRWVRDG